MKFRFAILLILLFCEVKGASAQMPDGEVVIHRNLHYLKLNIPPLLNDTIRQLVLFNAQGIPLHRFIIGPSGRPVFIPFSFPVPGLYCLYWETINGLKFVRMLNANL